jgi:uncharacterized protein
MSSASFDDGVPDAVQSRPRVVGYDLARAIALFGMVLVNFRGKLEAHGGIAPLLWLGERFEGKAAAMFVLLAGVGISLRSHVDEHAPGVPVALVERAVWLIGVGVLLAHLWDADILHFHGVYLLLVLPLVRARTSTLCLLALAAMWIAMMLQHELDWSVQPSATTLSGATRHLLFSGLYPVFPWIAFMLIGMAIGRLDLSDPRVRRYTLAVALTLVIATAVLDELARWERQTGALALGDHVGWLTSWPRAPRPMFVVSGCATAVTVICLCISAGERWRDRPAILALVATGQLAFTLYVAHVVAILIPLAHGLSLGVPIEIAWSYALAFYVAAIAFAVWWRRRWPLGPIEGLMRQVIGRERQTSGVGLKTR